MLAYRVELTPDDNGTLLVTCPELPEVTTYGEDRDDALMRGRDAIEEAIAARIAARQAIPEGVAEGEEVVFLPVGVAAKVALYNEMLAAGVRKAELARRLSLHGPQVDRLLNIRHASRLDQMEAAFGALGKRLEIRAK